MTRFRFTEAERRFLARMRVGRLATADMSGQPHVVPIVFVATGQQLYTPLDEKPKRVAPGQLRRVRNILNNPRVAVVVDEYDEDWSRLAWVLITGTAEFVEEGEEHAAAVRLLRDKYPQYGGMHLEQRPMIIIRPTRVVHWGALGA